MGKIEGVRIRNYRSLKDVTLGRLWHDGDAGPLTSVVALLGGSGVGKSMLFDAFGFLLDSLRFGVAWACNTRGGWESIRSWGESGPLRFEVCYREDEGSFPMIYDVMVDVDAGGCPYVSQEVLMEDRQGGEPFSFLFLGSGKGFAWRGRSSGGQSESEEIEGGSEIINLKGCDRLGVSVLGVLEDYPCLVRLRSFLEGWYVNFLGLDAVRDLSWVLTQMGLCQGVEGCSGILKRIADRIPGLDRMEMEMMDRKSGRVSVLRFYEEGGGRPFFLHEISEGVRRMVTYLSMVDRGGVPLPTVLFLESPDVGLCREYVRVLMEGFREGVQGRDGVQIFVTTYRPCLVDELDPGEVWVIEKGGDGFSMGRCAGDDALVNNMVAEGLPLGNLWHSGYLERSP